MSRKTSSSGADGARGGLRLRPAELLGFSIVLGVFTGLVVLYSTREIALAGIYAGVAFLVGVILLAVFGLAAKPNDIGPDGRHEDEEAEDPGR